MKVVILAGGFGTRISEESQCKPKPMIDLGGRPILWHVMKHYSHYGFNEFVICARYKTYGDGVGNVDIVALLEFHKKHAKGAGRYRRTSRRRYALPCRLAFNRHSDGRDGYTPQIKFEEGVKSL